MQEQLDSSQATPAWVAQAWASFALSVGGTLIGVYNLPVDHWFRAFLAMGIVFSVGSCLSLAKTIRDTHESKRAAMRKRGDEALEAQHG